MNLIRGIARSKNPPIEEALKIPAGGAFHHLAEIVGAGLLEFPLLIEGADAAEERIFADEAPQHVQHHRAFVVDDGTKNPVVSLNVSEPISEIDRTFGRRIHRGPSHLPKNAGQTAFPIFLSVERGKVLRERLAEPLLVIILPTHRLAPPLVRQFVRDEERGKVFKVHRIVAPHDRRSRHQLIQDSEVRRAVTARAIALCQRERKNSDTERRRGARRRTR